jgi:hypothetical protein
VERAEEAARTPVTAAFGDPGVGELTAAGDAVIGRIGELAREMRLLGSRVGAGELRP